MHLNWKNCYKAIIWEKLAANYQINTRFIFKKNVCPCPGAIYLYKTIIFKHNFLFNHLANQSQIKAKFLVEPPWEVGAYIFKDGRHAHICLKTLKVYYPEMMTLGCDGAILQKSQIWLPVFLNRGKTVRKSFNGKILQQMTSLRVY